MKRFRKLIIASLLLSFAGIAYGASTWTSLLHLQKAGRGTANWDTITNNNWQRIDNAWSDYQNALTDLPEVYQLPGTFNGTAGVVINLPKTVGATDDYAVNIQPSSYGGTDIADIKVVRGLSSFTVYSEGNNAVDTFIATVHYESDLATYGNQVFRRWIVSPDASITDHTDASVAGSLAQILTVISGATSEIVFPASHTYVLGWGKSYTSMALGAIFDDATKTLIKAGETFVTKGFMAGMPIHISGSTSNDGYYRIDSVDSETQITLIETPVDETTSGAAVVQMAIPSYVNLVFDKGAMLDDDSTGYSLWMYHAPTSRLNQVFQWTGAVYFSSFATIYPEWFGAVANAASVCSATASNQARTAIEASGGEIVFSPGIYYAVLEPFSFSSKITLRGAGSGATKLKMADGADLVATLQNNNWSTLENSNTWFVDTEGCPYGFGIVGMTIDGNRDNNTAGWSLRTYGKGFSVDDVVVKDGHAGGWWSECGAKTGQHDASDGADIPDTKIGYVDAIENNGIGILWRGPHDGYMENIYAARNEAEGLKVELLANYYSGSGLNINQMHTYTNYRSALNAPGVLINATTMGGNWIIEDGLKIGASTKNFHLKYLKFRQSGKRDHTAFECLGDDLAIGTMRPGLSSNDIDCTFTDTGDLVNAANHGLSDNDIVIFSVITTTTGIVVDTIYYVVTATTNTFQVAATLGGAALPLTTNGTGAFMVANNKICIRLAGQRGIISSIIGWIGPVEYSTWLDIDGDGYKLPSVLIKGSVTNGPAGTAIRIGQSSAAIRNEVNAYVIGCATAVNYVTQGLENRVSVQFLAEDGSETLLDGNDPDATDRFDLQMLYGTDYTYVKNTARRDTISKTADYVIPSDLFQTNVGEGPIMFDNYGSSGTITFTLPSGLAGMEAAFVRRENHIVRVDPSGAQYIGGAGSGKYLQLDVQWDTAVLRCVVGGRWVIVGGYGTPSFE